MGRFVVLIGGLFVLTVVAAVEALAVIGRGADAAASHPSAGRLAARFLITAGPRSDYSKARLEIVGRRGRVIRLVADGPFSSGASLSPDRMLVAWRAAGGIQVENVDGANSRLLVPCPVGTCSGPFVWSPDSRKLLIRDAEKALAVVSVSTGAVDEIIPPQPNVRYLPIAWSRPVHAILFLQIGAPGAPVRGKELVVASPSGASQRTIYHSSYEPIASWSPNGRWVAFTTERPQSIGLGIVNTATRTTKRVNFSPFWVAPVWAPNSSRFAIPGYRIPKSIALFSPAGKRLDSLKPTSGYLRAWTSGGIYLTTPIDQGRRLLVIPHGQQKPRTVFTLPKGQTLIEVQPF